MRQFLWVLLGVMTGFSAIGQSSRSISGQITNTIDQQLNHIKIVLVEANLTTYTNTQGQFEFESLQPQHYTLYAAYDGFNYQAVTVDLTQQSVTDVQLSVGVSQYTLETVELRTLKLSEALKNNAIKADIIALDEHRKRANSVEELMNRSPGVKIRNIGGLGGSSNIIVGGFSGNAVKLLYDNIPIDYLGSNYGLTKVPTNAVDRIEIYKGVLPSKIGVDALGGAINIMPNVSDKTSGTISYEFGSFNTHIVTINGQVKLADHLFVGTNSFFNYSDNDYKVDDLPFLDQETGRTDYIRARLFHNAFKQRSFEGYAQLRDLSWAELLEFKVNSYSLHKEIQNDPYSRARPFGQVYREENGNFIPSLKYKNHFLDNRLSVNQFLMYSQIDYELVDPAKNVYYDWKGQAHTTNSGSEMGNILVKDGYMHNTSTQFTSRTYLNYLLADNWQVESNTVYSHYNNKSNNDALNPDGTSYNKLVTNLALNSKLLDRRLESNTQLKYYYGHLSGYYETSDNPLIDAKAYKAITNTGVSFSQALKYNFNRQNYVRLSYENTYRLPSQRELFGDNSFVVANYKLVPEESRNYNLGFTHADEQLRFEVNAYYRDIKNLIRLKNLNQYQAKYLNLDKVNGLGVELSVTYTPIEHLTLSGNLTWNDFRLESSRDKSIDNQVYKNARIANMPFYYGNVEAVYNFRELLNLSNDLSLFWNYSYVHQYYLDFIEKQFEPDGFLGLWGTSKINTSRIIPEQHVHNIGLVYVRNIQGHRVSFGAELKNAFNAAVYNAFKMQSPGRHFSLKITYSL